MTINDVGNDLINTVTNLKINDIQNNLINKVVNLTVNDVGNDSKRATASDVKVQLVDDSAKIYHQNLLSRQMIKIRNEEVHVLVPLTEPIIIANNQPDMTVSTGII